jgi:hypothetical protein
LVDGGGRDLETGWAPATGKWPREGWGLRTERVEEREFRKEEWNVSRDVKPVARLRTA